MDDSVPASVSLPGRETAPFARLAAFICMIPRCNIADPKVKETRREMVKRGLTGTHRPDARLNERDTHNAILPRYHAPAESERAVWELV